MYRRIGAIGFMALALTTAPLSAQLAPSGGADRPGLARQKFSGPRFGVTAFTGDVAKYRSAMDKAPVMTQFGWQFETRIVASEGGGQALMEWVALVGGVEQDELNLSLSWLAGYRLANGVEFGVGPNFSVNKDSNTPTTSMILAGGVNVPVGSIYMPLNLAVGLARGGPRFTLLVGWVL